MTSKNAFGESWKDSLLRKDTQVFESYFLSLFDIIIDIVIRLQLWVEAVK